MAAMKKKKKRGSNRTLARYRYQASDPIAYWIILGIFLPGYVCIAPTAIQILLAMPVVGIIFLLAMLLPVYVPLTETLIDRLEVTPEGIRWWRDGFRRTASWEMLRGFGYEDYFTRYGKATRGVLFTDRASLPLSRFVETPVRVYSGDDEALEAFKQTEFGRYLWQYAPHVFQSIKTKNDS